MVLFYFNSMPLVVTFTALPSDKHVQGIRSQVSLHFTQSSENEDQEYLYDEFGCELDDPTIRWAQGDIDFLKNNSIDIRVSKLSDEHENILYTIATRYNDEEFDDRVLHVYEERGATSRYYAPIGRNSNGLPLHAFESSLNKMKNEAMLIAFLQLGIVSFIGSGELTHLYHDFTVTYRDKDLNDLLTATGLLTFFSSKFAQWFINEGFKTLNPVYQFKTIELLNPPTRRICSKQVGTNELIADVLMDRLDPFYNGALKHGALNPELKVSLKGTRQKSDHNWIRELKMALLKINEKRSRMLGVYRSKPYHEVQERYRYNKELQINIEQYFKINCNSEFALKDDGQSLKSEVLEIMKNNNQLFDELLTSLDSEFRLLGIELDKDKIAEALENALGKLDYKS